MKTSQARAATGRQSAGHPHDATGGWTTVPVRLSTNIGFTVTVDPKMADPITDAYLFGSGDTLDDSLLELMLGLVRPGRAVLDLGAFVGTFSLAAAAAGCKVLSVEASPHNVALLTRSAARNGFASLRVVNAAVLDAPGIVHFCPAGPWGHVRTESDSTSITIPAITVDDLLACLNWEDVAFVKMDVEGSEIRAIRGMARLLNRPDPPVVLFESNLHILRSSGLSASQLLDEWNRFGYECYLIGQRRLVRTLPDELQPQTVANYLAVKGSVPIVKDWTVESSMSLEEKVSRLIEEAALPQGDHRLNAALTLKEAPAEILSLPEIGLALDALAGDDLPAVSSAARWWKKSGSGERLRPEAEHQYPGPTRPPATLHHDPYGDIEQIEGPSGPSGAPDGKLLAESLLREAAEAANSNLSMLNQELSKTAEELAIRCAELERKSFDLLGALSRSGLAGMVVLRRLANRFPGLARLARRARGATRKVLRHRR